MIDQKHQEGEIDMDKLISQLAVMKGMRIDGVYVTRYSTYFDYVTGKSTLKWRIDKIDD